MNKETVLKIKPFPLGFFDDAKASCSRNYLKKRHSLLCQSGMNSPRQQLLPVVFVTTFIYFYIK